jgi:hypothetical protein
MLQSFVSFTYYLYLTWNTHECRWPSFSIYMQSSFPTANILFPPYHQELRAKSCGAFWLWATKHTTQPNVSAFKQKVEERTFKALCGRSQKWKQAFARQNHSSFCIPDQQHPSQVHKILPTSWHTRSSTKAVASNDCRLVNSPIKIRFFLLFLSVTDSTAEWKKERWWLSAQTLSSVKTAQIFLQPDTNWIVSSFSSKKAYHA